LELNESFEAGVRREVLEETGVEVTVERLTGVYKEFDHELSRWCTAVGRQGAKRNMTEEAREIRWMTTEEVQSAMVPRSECVSWMLLGKHPQSRAHDGVNLV